LDLLGNGEIKRQPTGNHGSGKKLSNGKEMGTGVTVAAYGRNRTVTV
jgi:hypothetical protein